MNVPFSDFRAEIQNRGNLLRRAIDRVLNSGYFTLGKEVKEFEKKFAKFLGVRYCIGVGNGLEAIQIALMALKIGPGDEVITTPLSAVATTLAILAVGAKPVFVDTNDRGLIDPNLIPKVISKKTRAILPVHLYGQPCHLEKIQTLCREYKLFLIEDAAQAHGSIFHGKKLGTFGDFGCFSFYPTKNLSAFGDAGAIVTNDKKLADLCYQIRDYGQKRKYDHRVYGLNSRLDEIQAAILRVKLRFLHNDNKKRQALVQRYCKKLSKLPLQIVTAFSKDSNFHLFVVRTPQRLKLSEFLSRHGIQTFIHYPKIIPEQPFLKERYRTDLPKTAKALVRQILSLPCYPQMTAKHVDYICEKISLFFKA